MKSSDLRDLIPEIAREFVCNGIVTEEELRNLDSELFLLVPSEESDAIQMFGYTLVLLSGMSVREDLPFSVTMDLFHDRILMGRDFLQRRASLKGINKTTGRLALQLVRSMSDSQLKLYMEWEDAAIRGLGKSRLRFIVGYIEETYQWIGEVLATRH